MDLLEYERQIFIDSFKEDGLLVMASGLGIERVFTAFLKLYCEPDNLVLVLNTKSHDEEFFIKILASRNVSPLPRVISAGCGAFERHAVYRQGGVLFITSRILIVDLLLERIPAHHIHGVLVYNADRIIESCPEAFIMRLYRQKNKTGFIKAFSGNPLSLMTGFCQVEKVMKSLFVRKLFLWPRFHAMVVSCLDQHKVDVIELQLHLTPAMNACQTSLLDLIDACIKELKTGNTYLNMEDITTEMAVMKDFDHILHLLMEPVWHQLSAKTKQLVSDLKSLREILMCLTQYDSLTFCNLVDSIKISEKIFGSSSSWLFLDAADELFTQAKNRIFTSGSEKKQKVSDVGKPATSNNKECSTESCPKWQILLDILQEIDSHKNIFNPSTSTCDPSMLAVDKLHKTLIVAYDQRTCNQLTELMSADADRLLHSIDMSTFTMANATENSDSILSTAMSNTSLPIICSLYDKQDPTSLLRTLYQIKPTFVILYDAEISFVRQLEVFHASRPGQMLRVYFLMYVGSTEEQRYLTSLRKEKEAFEYLIREKANMVIPEEREGKSESFDVAIMNNIASANEKVISRKGGLHIDSIVQKVIVDIREFRSQLPSLLYRRDIEIVPVTLEVGDYILTPDICVERKSISDLIDSLNKGRLYNQCVAMCRCYRRPVLLIEFDANKPFILNDCHALSSELNSNDITSRLVLLTLHFPQLRILWCQSPHIAAELFHELKVGRDQPDTNMAVAVTESKVHALNYNIAPQDMLMRIPGINTKNITVVMKQVESIADLVTLSRDNFMGIFGNSAITEHVYQFLHNDYYSIVKSKSKSQKVHGKLACTSLKTTKRFPLRKI